MPSHQLPPNTILYTIAKLEWYTNDIERFAGITDEVVYEWTVVERFVIIVNEYEQRRANKIGGTYEHYFSLN